MSTLNLNLDNTQKHNIKTYESVSVQELQEIIQYDELLTEITSKIMIALCINRIALKILKTGTYTEFDIQDVSTIELNLIENQIKEYITINHKNIESQLLKLIYLKKLDCSFIFDPQFDDVVDELIKKGFVVKRPFLNSLKINNLKSMHGETKVTISLPKKEINHD